MNYLQLKAIYIAGMQAWLNDKKSIILRLLVFPNLVPIGFILFLLVATAAMHTRDTNGSTSPSGNVVFTVVGDGYAKEIASALKGKPLRYDYRSLTSEENNIAHVKNLISDKQITFAIHVKKGYKEQITLNIIYDREREYVSKNWLNAINQHGTSIALAIRKSHFKDSGVSDKALSKYLSKIDIVQAPYGESVSMVNTVLIYVLWGVLLMYPLDSAISISTKQMLSDTREDMLPIWKSAGVTPTIMVLGRFFVSMSVFLICMVVVFMTLTIWLSLYLYLVDLLQPAMAQMEYKTGDQKEGLYMATIGFKSMITSIGWYSMFACLMTSIATAAFLILLRLRLSIYFSDAEQVRTKFLAYEIIINNLPMVGFVTGTFALSYYLSSIPLLNTLMSFQYLFKGGLAVGHLSVSLFSLVALSLFMLNRVVKKVGDQKRLMIHY